MCNMSRCVIAIGDLPDDTFKGYWQNVSAIVLQPADSKHGSYIQLCCDKNHEINLSFFKIV